MNFRLSFAVAISLCIATPGFSAPSAQPEPHYMRDRFQGCYQQYKKCDGPLFCEGTVSSNPSAICGDPRLGPVKLPSLPPFSDMLFNYNRFGGLCPGAFLEKWTNTKTGKYNYPENEGCQLDNVKHCINGTQSLAVGLVVDRFGWEDGEFLSPVGTPYAQRALPPINLVTPTTDPTIPFNYHVYEVIKSFDVISGPTVGWFDQSGQGTQYKTPAIILKLVEGGFLARVDVKSERGMEKIRRALEKPAL